MDEIKVFAYTAPLPFTQIVNKRRVSTKEGLLVQVENDFLVDLSPFSGFSQLSLKECLRDFKFSLKNNLKTHSNPHVSFALFQLKIQRENKTINRVRSNTLLSPQSLLKSPLSLSGVVKTKLQAQSIRTILEAIEKYPKVKWRLDANASFETQDLLELERKLLPYKDRIDYLEEPLKNFEDYHLLTLPFAHEEHIGQYLKKKTNACAVVLKPSQVGMEILKKIKVTTIISSAFETPPALDALHALANTKKNAPKAHGLGAFLSFDQLNWT